MIVTVLVVIQLRLILCLVFLIIPLELNAQYIFDRIRVSLLRSQMSTMFELLQAILKTLKT